MPFYHFYTDVDIGSHGSTSYFQHDVMAWTKRHKSNLRQDQRIMIHNSPEGTGYQSRFVCGTDLDGQTPAAPG